MPGITESSQSSQGHPWFTARGLESWGWELEKKWEGKKEKSGHRNGVNSCVTKKALGWKFFPLKLFLV